MSKNYAVIIQFVTPLTTFYRSGVQKIDAYKWDEFVTSWRFHNCAWQPQCHDHLSKTSGTLWVHRGALTNQWCSLATGCGIKPQSPLGEADGNSMIVEPFTATAWPSPTRTGRAAIVVMQGPYLLNLFTAQQIQGRVRKQLLCQQSLWWISNRTNMGLIPYHPLLLLVGRLPPHHMLLGWTVVCIIVFCLASLCQSLMAHMVGIAHRQDLALGPGLGLPHLVRMGPLKQQTDIGGLSRDWVGLKALIRGLLKWMAYPIGVIFKEKLVLYS